MTRIAALAALVALVASCAGPGTTGSTGARTTTTARVDPAQAARLQRLMVPLVKVMDKPVPIDQLRVGVVDDPQINAANAGSGQFYVTTGLLGKANDDRLTAVLAHELAHEDLNHVAKAQVLSAGLNIGAAILEQILPGSGVITPVAGELLFRKYTRDEEFAADRHGVELLRRAGHPKSMMIDALSWLTQASGSGGGGFLSTHPGTADRIEAIRKLP
jgi:Zn-dependent protease with chaperone function